MQSFLIKRRLLLALGAAGMSSCLVACNEKRSSRSPTQAASSPKSQGATESQPTAAASSEAAESPPTPEQTAVAVLAGGCFWGMQDILREVPGVLETEVGYAGGRTQSPRYREVKTGKTGHAESVRVVFDPQRITYAELLENWFFRMHDPTTENRQGNDVGSQYRSAIFYADEGQRRVAEAVKKKMGEGDRFSDPIVTEIAPLKGFTPAEEVHQDYLEKNPGGYTCHYLREWD